MKIIIQNKKITIVLSFCLALCSLCYGGNPTDSLLKLLNKVQTDTARINLLNGISKCMASNNPKKALLYADSAEHLAQKKGYLYGLAKAHNNKGISYYYQGEYTNAIEQHSLALQIRKKINNPKELADSYNNIGAVYYNLGDYKKALDYFINGAKIKEKVNDVAGLASSYNNIGTVYFSGMQYQNALKYYLKALEIWKGTNDKKNIGSSHSNIGNAYKFIGNDLQAKEYYTEALNIAKEINNKQSMSIAYGNLANIYEKEKKYQEAVNLYFKSLELKNQINDKNGSSLILISIATLYFNKGEIDKAIKYAQRSLAISKKIGAKENIKYGFSVLAEAFEKKKEYKQANHYNKLYSNIKDSLLNEQNSKQIDEIEIKYETEKKESEIKLLNNENQIKTLHITLQQQQLLNQKKITIALFIGVILIIIISLLIFSRNKAKQKENFKIEQLNQQKHLTNTIIKMQEKERNRIALDLHDGIGQTLAGIKINLTGIIANGEIIEKKNKPLFNQTIQSIDNAYNEVRNLSHNMMPKSLEEAGLTEAIDDLLSKTFIHSQIKYSFEKDQTINFDKTTAIGLYRIFQELINNILKHALASEVHVHLHKIKNLIILIVEDNGIGIKNNFIESDAVSFAKKGMGMSNIEARVQALNGFFSISSGQNKGTVAIIRIPISNDELLNN